MSLSEFEFSKTYSAMLYVTHLPKLFEVFCSCDDFCIAVKEIQQKQLPESCSGKAPRKPELTESDMMSIVIFYHLSGLKCFEYYLSPNHIGRIALLLPQSGQL